MSENQDKKVYKKFSIYFSEKEYDYINKRAEKRSLKAGIFIKSLLIEAFKNDEEEEDNPFKKKS